MPSFEPDDRFHENPEEKQYLDSLAESEPEHISRTRTPFERDRDRILYSNAFRRLSGVTQVARADETYNYHTRLTHSIKVEQIARRLAEYLAKSEAVVQSDYEINPSVAAAASLAHDLGHPPFGHATEEELDYQIKQKGVEEGFEGNPQSLRIVNRTEISKRYLPPDNPILGLNLCRKTLNAMIKYPWKRGATVPGTDVDTKEKWGFYREESEIFKFARANSEQYVKSLEAQIMDWADDVTYAIHDVIDFYRAGLIPLGELLTKNSRERNDFIAHFEDKYGSQFPDLSPDQFLTELVKSYLMTPEIQKRYQSTRITQAVLDRIRSGLIRTYLRVPDIVQFVVDNGTPQIKIKEEERGEVEFLKEMTVYYVIDDRSLMTQQHGQRRIIKTLFDTFWQASIEKSNGDYSKFEEKIIPLPYRNELVDRYRSGASDPGQDHTLTDRGRARRVADTITALSERQALTLYKRISGDSPGSLQESIVR